MCVYTRISCWLKSHIQGKESLNTIRTISSCWWNPALAVLRFHRNMFPKPKSKSSKGSIQKFKAVSVCVCVCETSEQLQLKPLLCFLVANFRQCGRKTNFHCPIQFCRGVRHDCGTALNEATTIMGYWVWSTQRTCIYHFSFRYGMWLTREPPCRLQQFAFFNLSIFNQFTTLRSILTGELQSISELTTLLSDPFWPGVLFCFARTIHSKSTIC